MTITFSHVRTIARETPALAAAVVVSFLVCYADAVASLVGQWTTNDMYAHGFLIPFISVFLLWERRSDLARTPIKPDTVGGSALLALALTMLVVARLASVITLEQISMVVALFGVVLTLFGRRLLRQVCFPLLFLLFMIPVWDLITSRLHTPFQLLSAQIGTSLLRAVGIPIHLDGVMIQLPNITLEVAQACSGVNFLVAILALAMPQAYLMLASARLQVLVAMLAVIVAVLTNGLRVAVIGVLAYFGGPAPDIHGPGHILQGLFVAVVGFAVLFAIILLLAKRSPRTTAPPEPAREAVSTFRVRQSLPRRLAAGVAVLLLAAAALTNITYAEPRQVEPSLDRVPMSIGPWFTMLKAKTTPFRVAGADDELSRTYLGPSRRAVSVYVAYLANQTQGKELVSEDVLALHSHAARVGVRRLDGTTIEANELVRSINGRDQYVVFWYRLNGRAIANQYEAKAWSMWDTLVRRRNDGAMVMLVADVPPGVDASSVRADVHAFAGLAGPVIARQLPQ